MSPFKRHKNFIDWFSNYAIKAELYIGLIWFEKWISVLNYTFSIEDLFPKNLCSILRPCPYLINHPQNGFSRKCSDGSKTFWKVFQTVVMKLNAPELTLFMYATSIIRLSFNLCATTDTTVQKESWWLFLALTVERCKLHRWNGSKKAVRWAVQLAHRRKSPLAEEIEVWNSVCCWQMAMKNERDRRTSISYTTPSQIGLLYASLGGVQAHSTPWSPWPVQVLANCRNKTTVTVLLLAVIQQTYHSHK